MNINNTKPINFNKEKSGIRSFIVPLIIVIISIGFFFAVYNNSEMYQRTVVKVTEVKEEGDTQVLAVKVMNGESKNKKVIIKNSIDSDLVYKEKYREGNFLFVNLSNSKILQQKRDYYLALLVILLADLLLLIGRGKGIYTILGLFLNCILYLSGIHLFNKGLSPVIMVGALILVFTAVILFPLNGFSRETGSAIISTILTVGLIAATLMIIVGVMPRISYEFMEYMPEPYSLHKANMLYVSQLVVAALGGIMDISVTVTSSASEILARNPDLGAKKLLSSISAISDDITSLMINVVFFTNMAGILPVFTIAMKNDISFFTVLKHQSFFEVSGFLIGAIGIVLAIPLSAYMATLVLKRRRCEK